MANIISLMKVLIIKPSSLGDVVHALRVVAVLKKKLKPVEIHWVIKKGLEGIIDASGLVDKSFLFNRGQGLREFFQLGRSLRRESYDMVLDMQGLLRSAFLARIANGRSCFGRPDGRELSTFFYKTTNHPVQKEPHAIDRLSTFLEIFNLRAEKELNLSFNVSNLEGQHSAKLVSKNKKILLFPETRRHEKCWPFFKDLARKLKQNQIGDVIISGIEKDNLYPSALDLRGSIPLISIPALVSEATLVVANDSAPLHIASAMGIPTLGIFGPTNPIYYGPYPLNKKNGEVICSPTSAISEVGVNHVFNKILSMLESVDP